MKTIQSRILQRAWWLFQISQARWLCVKNACAFWHFDPTYCDSTSSRLASRETGRNQNLCGDWGLHGCIHTENGLGPAEETRTARYIFMGSVPSKTDSSKLFKKRTSTSVLHSDFGSIQRYLRERIVLHCTHWHDSLHVCGCYSSF